MKVLKDSFGRKFPYLRLSVTEVCNFRCTYCLPNGYQKTDRDFLTLPEITRLATAFAELGTHKIRLTGGEPTVRKDLTQIARAVSSISGIRTVALTTNGYNLKENARAFLDAGINALNVSVDSLNSERFHAITGQDKLAHVLEGIEAAKTAGFTNIKINSVLLKEVTDHTLPEFLSWIKREALSVRFIELMQTGENLAFFKQHHISANVIIQQLLEHGFVPELRKPDSGPAQEFTHPDYAGKIGIIAPYSKDFCKSCNRLRVTSRGKLMLCLFGEGGYNLRPYLQADDQREELIDAIASALHFKHETHYLQQGITGSTPHLATLGG
ncbi:MAG: GTP 3',8-cyclase MoaA [Alphaproteobacteria bacterium]|nr:GTP 3',8-cyclase MoaA [Alphaproteobacteria bacterium]